MYTIITLIVPAIAFITAGILWDSRSHWKKRAENAEKLIELAARRPPFGYRIDLVKSNRAGYTLYRCENNEFKFDSEFVNDSDPLIQAKARARAIQKARVFTGEGFEL